MKMTKIASLLLVVVLCVGMLAACGGVSSYEKKLEKAGYTIEVAEKDELKEASEELAAMNIEGELKAAIEAQKGTDMVMVYEFSKADAAESFASTMGALAGLGGMKVEQDGKIVIMGTAAGVDAAMGK